MNMLRPRRLVAIILLLQLAACSGYSGPISNAPSAADSNGPPLLTNQFAP